ncbi:PAS domain S-box protein [Nostocaceae cyanobacterium CENA369]|uniref:PAS domain S-box protein n=1 Tax=Dendronalium phyllosphericum CENA369 TaxID=1725256 RepID=A0A8J7I7Q5_9NOST|nr:PAS domain S-box protein [Dendronalium phyllosphericum]MBH8576355.1 PAS domain S-box protein [Dendronalium phyllosphericum CENA369]
MKTFDDMKLEIDVPFVMTDNHGLVTYVNDCFTSVFGWSTDEIKGQIITVIIPKSFHAPHHLGFSRFLTTEKSSILNHPIRLIGITKDGKEIPAEHLIVAEKHQGVWAFMAILRPL